MDSLTFYRVQSLHDYSTVHHIRKRFSADIANEVNELMAMDAAKEADKDSDDNPLLSEAEPAGSEFSLSVFATLVSCR